MNRFLFDPELIFLFYIAGCISVLVFGVLYVILNRFNKWCSALIQPHIKRNIEKQMNLILSKGTPGKRYFCFLRKRLLSLRYMKNFIEALTETQKKYTNEEFDKFRSCLQNVFEHLIRSYKKKDDIGRGYLAYAIEKIGFTEKSIENSSIALFLINLTGEKNVYLRENSLKALCSNGCVHLILLAWRKMENTQNCHDSRLLVNLLLMFKGSRDELAWVLWRRRKEFSPSLVLPVMKYIRLSSGSFREEFCSILKDKNENSKLRLEAVRYFRKYPYEPAREMLYELLSEENTSEWEYSALSASTLSAYPGDETIYWLKKMIYSSNWYVSLNSAKSLAAILKVSAEALSEICSGNCPAAKEIFEYVVQHSRIQVQLL
ncbi:MAG: hypothetical protein ACI4JD_03175 [Ruminococcus sp.]